MPVTKYKVVKIFKKENLSRLTYRCNWKCEDWWNFTQPCQNGSYNTSAV